MRRFQRADRVSEEIMKEVSNIIRKDMKDPRLGLVSVTRVELSRDLRNARIFVSVLGGDIDKKSSMQALRGGAGFIRGLIGKRLRLRVTPEIVFKLDESMERSARISRILREVIPAEKKKEEETPEDEE